MTPEVGKLYRHKKGTLYRVIAIASYNENPSEYTSSFWVAHVETSCVIEIYLFDDGHAEHKFTDGGTLIAYQDTEHPAKKWGRSEQVFSDGRFVEEGDRND
ncbi:MAG TPA: hypothetical protein V6C57_23640 [Coleofasciculaceae cyanobacterium]